jgi:hypothetical protein
MVIRKVGVWSVARMYGALCAVVGFIVGGLLALLSIVGMGAAIGAADDTPAWLVGAFGVGAVITLPIFYGVMGLVSGAIGAVLYNLFASMVGGIEIEVDEPRHGSLGTP